MTILVNSSKTMAHVPAHPGMQPPHLLTEAQQLAHALSAYSPAQLASLMHISAALSVKTHDLLQNWGTSSQTTAALDAFQGDIYRGLKAPTFDEADRQFAEDHLRILSGLYGILQPFDAIEPYRLELLYNLKVGSHKNLYSFWADKVARRLPASGPIVQLASVEYYRLIEPYVDKNRIITPWFLTRQGDQAPTFVTVHAKVARGAFARWLITSRTTSAKNLHLFAEDGYQYDASQSSPVTPTFVRNM